MTPHVLIRGFMVGATFLAGQTARAETATCAERAELVTHLAQRYGETRQAIGLSSSTQVVEIFASDETGTWTITVTRPDGVACMVAAGQNFEKLDEELTPAMLDEAT